MTKKLRWGFLGTGWIAGIVAEDFALAGLEIHAVGSRHLESAEKFASQYGVARAHGSYQGLVDDPEIDVVYISTINPLHLENTLQAINAGKHVLLEKPITMNAKQAHEIYSAAKAKKVFIMEAMWTRFLPMHDAIFKCIADGVIGEPRFMQADHSRYLPAHEKHERLWEPELGGGALLDLGIYPASFIYRVFGKPDKILGASHLTEKNVDERTSAIFAYNDGRQATFSVSIFSPGPTTAFIIGTQGRIEITYPAYEQATFEVFDRDRNRIDSFDFKAPGTGRQFQAIEVERCISLGLLESDRMSFAESVQIMESLDEIGRQGGVQYL